MYSSYSPYKNTYGETIEVGRAVIEAIEKYLPTDLFLTRVSGEIDEISSSVSILLGRDKKNDMTETLAKLDTDRDNIANVMESRIEDHIRVKEFNPDEAESAERLIKIFNNTAIDPRVSYTEQSAQVNSRIDALNNNKSRADMEVTGILNLFNGLVSKQDSFEKLSSKKYYIESVKLRGSVKDEVKKITKRINYVLPYLESQYGALPTEYETPAKEILHAINRVMTTANARQTRRESVEAN